MTDWRSYWNEAPQVHAEDPLRQVGKTVNGVVIAPALFAAIVRDVRGKLDLQPGDALLDLCCGNGALSHEFAHACASVVGVDFSAPLIETARQRFAGERIEYVLGDACDPPAPVLARRFDKVVMYEALQHFSTAEARRLLAALSRLPVRPARLLFGSVPDEDRLWNFYDTPQRREEYERRRRDGTEAIGHWWPRGELRALLAEHGWQASFLPQDPALNGAHYRMDVLCVPAQEASP